MSWPRGWMFGRAPVAMVAMVAMVLLSSFCLRAERPQVSPGQPPRSPGRPQPAPVGNGTITGRVIAADTTLPIPGAQVRAFRSGSQEPLLARTDGEGRFVFTGVANGSYRLVASRAPFLAQEYGQQWPGEPGWDVTVANSRTVSNITVTLPPGGVISGRVLDEFGLPVVWAEVKALRITYEAGDRMVTVVGSELTNDRGQFRLFGLSRGDYYVSADPSRPPVSAMPARNGPAPTTAKPGESYAPTYYPSEVRTGMGQRLRVDSILEVAGIDITLLPTALARVAGIAVMSDGSPMGAASVTLTGTVLKGHDVPSTVTTANGEFEFIGVAPDQYILRASARPSASDEFETAVLDVNVSDGDLDDLVLAGQPDGTIRGRIVADGERLPSLAGVHVRAMSTSSRARSGARVPETVVERDGSFALKLQPGSMWMGPVNLPAGWMLKAVRNGATDVTDSGLEIGPTQEIAGITMVVTSQISAIHGTVRDTQGRPAPNSTVIVFARDSRRWRVEQRYVRPVRTGATGQFEVRGLPAGDYLALAVDHFVPPEDDAPDLFERLQRGRTTTLAVTEGGSVVVNLTVQPLPR